MYLDDITNWESGTKIVLATTDFSEMIDSALIKATSSLAWRRGAAFPNQNEVLTVVTTSKQARAQELRNIDKNVVTVAEPVKYLHWGSGYEKAEVGLLTRNIVIQGDDSSVSSMFGGHLMIRNADVSIYGVEFTKMGKIKNSLFLMNLGQKGNMGRYPIHFHNMGNMIGRGLYARDNSLHDNFQRCIVIHGKYPSPLQS